MSQFGSGAKTAKLLARVLLAAPATTMTISGLALSSRKKYMVTWFFRNCHSGAQILSFLTDGDTTLNHYYFLAMYVNSGGGVGRDEGATPTLGNVVNGYHSHGTGELSYGDGTRFWRLQYHAIIFGGTRQNYYGSIEPVAAHSSPAEITSITLSVPNANTMDTGSYFEVWEIAP